MTYYSPNCTLSSRTCPQAAVRPVAHALHFQENANGHTRTFIPTPPNTIGQAMLTQHVQVTPKTVLQGAVGCMVGVREVCRTAFLSIPISILIRASTRLGHHRQR